MGLVGSPVLALRAQVARADAPLPPAEQPLLGGSSTVRGYRAGNRAGDSLAARVGRTARAAQLAAQLRAVRREGLRRCRHRVVGGTRLSDQPWDRGIGGGVYLGAAVFMLDVDVAWPETGQPRAHVSLGVRSSVRHQAA